MNESKKQMVTLPVEPFEVSGTLDHSCNISVGDGVIVVMKEKMTALETLNAFKHLSGIENAMLESIRAICGECSHCGDCCVYGGENLGSFDITSEMSRLLGFPEGTTVRATLSGEDDHIILTEADSAPNIHDVPRDTLELMKELRICCADLDELIQSEIPIYDGEESISEIGEERISYE